MFCPCFFNIKLHHQRIVKTFNCFFHVSRDMASVTLHMALNASVEGNLS
ncbi:hypothetical protein ECDEC4C_1662 [Escherichia coli DEC4C]|nr:hypothetical protein ECDEC4C_1662 [Escherichia coli DEC4C]